MLNNSDSTKAASTGTDAGTRRFRRGRSRHHRPVAQEDAGKWIWIAGTEEAHNSYIYARKLFELSEKPTQAILKTAADSRYKLYVNGSYVGKGPVRSGSGWTYYDTYDVTPYLSKGKNVIAFLVHYIGAPTNFAPLKAPGLICKAEITVGEENLTVVTDETWKVRPAADWTGHGARLSEALGYQEVYDSALRLDGWTQVKFKERGWEDAVVVGELPSKPWGRLVDREIPQLAEENVYPVAVSLYNSPERSVETPPAEVPALMAAAELTGIKSGSVKGADAVLAEEGVTKVSTPRSDVGVVILLDFGREVFGNVEIGVSGSASGLVDIGYGELLEDGRVKPDRAGMKYTDRLLLKKGKLEWQGFEPRAFRYMQLEFRRCSRAVALDYVRVNQSLYPVTRTSSFECSDDLLNQVWDSAAYTARVCMEDTFIDSPWRERAMWWGDARIQSRAAYYAFDDTTLLAQGLKQMASQQAGDGSLPGMYPGGSDKLVPDYSLHWVLSLLEYYAFSDDADLLRELYPNMQRLLEWFGGFVGRDGLLTDVPGWLFLDWAELDKRGEVTGLNCLYYHALRVAAMISSILGREDDALEYMQVSARLRIAVNKYLYSPKNGLYADCRVEGVLQDSFSSQTNVLAALFDVPDHYRKAGILRMAVGGSLPEINTPYFASHLVEVLCAGDRHVDALHVMRKRWGEMVKAGAATFGEFFSGEGSMCHGWSCGPVRDLIAEFVGIKPVLGSHRFSVSPRVGDLKWAKGSVNTNAGPLAVEWKVVRGVLTIQIDVPQGIKVDVYPPCPDDCKVTVNGRAQVSCFATLSGGSHTVRVAAAKPPKPAPFDKSLEPAPIPHVEILEDVMPRGRRRLGLATERRRRSKRAEGSGVETTIVDISAVDAPVELLSETGPEVTADETGEQITRSRRKRSRRGGKGRTRTAEIAGQAEAPEAEAVESTVEPADAAPESAEVAEAPSKSRRRRSRRSRTKSRAAEAAGTQEQAEPLAETVEQPEVELLEAVPGEALAASEEPVKTRKRRTRRGGRNRSRTAEPAEAVESVEVVPEEIAVPEEPSAEPETEDAAAVAPARSRRRRPRGRRGRGDAVKSETDAEASAADVAGQTQAPEPLPETAQAGDVTAEVTPEETRRTRRSRSRRPRKTEASQEQPSVAADVEPARPEPSPEPTEQTAPAVEDQPKRRRPRRPARKSAGETTVEASEPAQPVELSAAAPETESAPAAPKRTRSRSRKPKAEPKEEHVEQPAPQPVQADQVPAVEHPSEPASDAVEASRKRRASARRPRKKPDAGQES